MYHLPHQLSRPDKTDKTNTLLSYIEGIWVWCSKTGRTKDYIKSVSRETLGNADSTD